MRSKKYEIVYLKSSKGVLDINAIVSTIRENCIIVKTSANIRIISEEELIRSKPSQFSIFDIKLKSLLLRFIDVSKGQIRFMHILHPLEVIEMLEKNIEIRDEI